MWKLIRRVGLVIWLFVMVVLGAWIGFENDLLIQVRIMGASLPSLSVGVYLGIALIVGLVFGFFTAWLVTSGKVFQQSRRVKQAHQENLRLKQTLSN